MNSKDLLGQLAEHLSVRRAFGTAYERDGLLVIPVALVAGGGGGGEGTVLLGDGTGGSAGTAPSGSGGGFGGLVLPIGTYVVKDDSVRFVPVVNVTVIVLAGLSLVRLLVRSRGRGRRRHAHRAQLLLHRTSTSFGSLDRPLGPTCPNSPDDGSAFPAVREDAAK